MDTKPIFTNWNGILCLVFGALFVATVVMQIETVHLLEGWRWRLKPVETWVGTVFLMSALVSLLLVWFAVKYRGPVRLFFLFLFGLSTQIGPAMSTGAGISGLEDRAISTGHREFTVIASRDLDFSTVFSEYETLAAAPSQNFARSKPPGQLLGYMVLDRLSHLISVPDHKSNQRIVDADHARLIRFIAVFLPAFAALSLIPIFYLARRWLSPLHALWVAIAYASTPSFSLVQLHFDQSVYPMLTSILWVLSVYLPSTKARSGFLVGATAYLCAFVSFSLLPALIFVPLLLWSVSLWPNARYLAGLSLGGFGLVLLGFLAGYSPWTRYANAMQHHSEWKNWIWEPNMVAQFSLLNVVEWLWWIGPAIVLVLIFNGHWRALDKSIKRLVQSLVFVLLLILALGQTIGEVARLWCFLIPLFLICAVGRSKSIPSWLVILLLIVQLLTSYAFRYAQDFW